MTIKEHKELKNYIKGLIRESLELENQEFEMSRENPTKRENSNSSPGKTKRKTVIQWLKDPAVNCAHIMRQVWHPQNQKEEDSLRSYFYKCRDGAKNDSGEPYSFTDEDINALYRVKADTY